MRQDLFDQLSEIPVLNVNLDNKSLCDLLLFGDSQYNAIINRMILEATILFITYFSLLFLQGLREPVRAPGYLITPGTSEQTIFSLNKTFLDPFRGPDLRPRLPPLDGPIFCNICLVRNYFLAPLYSLICFHVNVTVIHQLLTTIMWMGVTSL